jgi:hypothetical protein
MTHEKIARSLTFDRDLQREIVSALRTVELEALERAAKVADELIVGNEPGPLHSHVAQQIRSLKEQAKESEGVR